MPEENQVQEPQEQEYYEEPSHTLRNILLGIAAVYIVVSLYFIVDNHGRVGKLEDAQVTSSVTQDKLQKQLDETTAALKQERAASEVLSSKLGITQKELQSRAAVLARQQADAEKRLQAEADAQKASLGQVSGDLAATKTDLGGTKTDLAATKTDLEATKRKLDSTVGDLGQQSGLIARTREDLEYLKHRGDRNIVEFTLKKGAKPTPVSTVSLQLKKVDAKRGKYTLNVVADDRTIEKKDRTVNEPLQFYTGRDRMLYEVVVMTVAKNEVSGYMSTPKNIQPPANQ